jgi:hypothetical protein
MFKRLFRRLFAFIIEPREYCRRVEADLDAWLHHMQPTYRPPQYWMHDIIALRRANPLYKEKGR